MKELDKKDLLGLEGMSAEEIALFLDTTASFKEISERAVKKVPALRGKTIVNLFFEPSTRTRASFELAEKRLSADAVNISKSTSSVVKGESLRDTAENLQAMKIDVIVIRHSASGAPPFSRIAARCFCRQRWRRSPRASDPGAPRYFHSAREARRLIGQKNRDRR